MAKSTDAMLIIGCLLYFFTYFLIVFGMLQVTAANGLDAGGASVTDPGFASQTNNPAQMAIQDFNTSLAPDQGFFETIGGTWTFVKRTFSFMFSFNANTGAPSSVSWIFVILFTYVPLIILILAILGMILIG